MRRASLALALVVALVGCKTTDSSPQAQTAALTLSSDSMAQRQMQMRRFDTKDESAVMNASAGVLQDIGFLIIEAQPKAGLITASKDRDAVESGQVTNQIILVVLAAALGAKYDPVWETDQKIRISVITRPSADKEATTVRVTFQRILWNNQRKVSRVETINDATIYQEFFDKLSQSMFLEAHEI